MRKSIRTLVSLIVLTLSCTILINVDMFASDVNANEIVLKRRWLNTEEVYTALSFSNATALCDARVVGVSGTTRISATIKLQKKVNGNFTDVKTWTPVSTSSELNFSNSYDVSKGYTYRLTLNATVTRNGVLESVSSSSEKTI